MCEYTCVCVCVPHRQKGTQTAPGRRCHSTGLGTDAPSATPVSTSPTAGKTKVTNKLPSTKEHFHTSLDQVLKDSGEISNGNLQNDPHPCHTAYCQSLAARWSYSTMDVQRGIQWALGMQSSGEDRGARGILDKGIQSGSGMQMGRVCTSVAEKQNMGHS